MNWSQYASARSWTQMDAAAINWTLPWRRSSESVFFELRPGKLSKEASVIPVQAQNSYRCEPLSASRISLRNRCLWEEADETVGKAVQRRSEKGKTSLETIRCRQRSTLGKGNAHEERQNRGCSGSTQSAI